MVAVATIPWREVGPLPAAEYRELRRAMLFDHYKWDPQVQDVATLGRTPLVLTASAWAELQDLAVRLYAETLAAEREMCGRPELLGALALPRYWARTLARASGAAAEGPRVMRFDFHHTDGGWRISEVNSDVPGGYIEAGPYSAAMAQHYGLPPTPDPAAELIGTLGRRIRPGARVALVYATAYADDAQVMWHLAEQLERHGYDARHAAADHDFWSGCDAVLRFFPAEWLANLPGRTDRRRFLAHPGTLLLNPASVLTTQSKRWPLLWDKLRCDVSTWRRLLPQTCAADPAQLNDPGWVFKPAFGRVGSGIGMIGCTEGRDWKAIRRGVRWWRRHWIMQRRFTPTPWATDAGERYPAIGVFVIDGRPAGVYARCGQVQLVDHRAEDLAVLVEPNLPDPPGPLDPPADRPPTLVEAPCGSAR